MKRDAHTFRPLSKRTPPFRFLQQSSHRERCCMSRAHVCCIVRCHVVRAYLIVLVSACESAGCTCVVCCVWSTCVQIITYFLFHTPHHQLPSWLPQSVWCNIATGGDEGAIDEIRAIFESVKIVSVYLIFRNNKIKVMVSFKCCDTSKNFHNALQWSAQIKWVYLSRTWLKYYFWLFIYLFKLFV
jgi:hypothetical protein